MKMTLTREQIPRAKMVVHGLRSPAIRRRHELANAPGCFHPSGRLARVV